MFKKPLSNLKTFSPLRSSDRKRFQNEAYDAYPHIKEKCSQEGASPLMPDSLRSAKFISHTDRQGVVYVADNKPLWIRLEGLKPIPTVYTLWEHPDMLPLLYTWSPVIRKLVEGADLMIPGLVPGPDGTLPDVKTDELVAITVKGYPYPLAVGTMALSTSEIRPRSGMKGKAVHIIHVYQDYLWKLLDKSDPPELEHLSDGEYEDDEEEEEGAEAEETVEIEQAGQPPAAEEPKQEEFKKLSVKEIDEVLKKSLLHALQFKITPENISSLLPMSASVLYSSYVLPSRPHDVGSQVDIKGSSWKKVQKFLKAMDKAQLLKIKEQRGETMVMSVNYSHPDFQGLQPYKTVEASAPSMQPNNVQQKSVDANGSKKNAEIEILEVFKPLGSSVCAFFEAAGKSKDDLYKAPEIKQIVQEYVKAKNIANPKNQRMVNLDDVLADAILKKSERASVSQLSREEVVQKLQAQMQPFHVLTLPGKEPVLRKGAPKPISITQEIRQGRKTVTKVVGVEQFDIDVAELCKELTKLCASSATYDLLHGSSPKNPVHEVMVQGPQSKLVHSHLQSMGAPKKMIQIEDKTNKKGKGKK